MTDAFVLGGVRTPAGRYGGSLSHIRTQGVALIPQGVALILETPKAG